MTHTNLDTDCARLIELGDVDQAFHVAVMTPNPGAQFHAMSELLEAAAQGVNDDVEVEAWRPFDVRTHNGKVTLENMRTGNHVTLQVRTERRKWRDGSVHLKRVLSHLQGSDWVRVGNVTSAGRVRIWGAYSSRDPHTPSKLDRIARLLETPWKTLRAGVLIHGSGLCRCCNRDLTHPDSIRLGIGPVCKVTYPHM